MSVGQPPLRRQPNALIWEDWKAELLALAGDSYGKRGPFGVHKEYYWKSAYLLGESPLQALEFDHHTVAALQRDNDEFDSFWRE